MVASAFNHIAYNRATVAAVIAVSYMYAVARVTCSAYVAKPTCLFTYS